MTTHAERARDVRHALAELLAEHGSYSGFIDSMLDMLLRDAFTDVVVDVVAALSAELAQLRTERDGARAECATIADEVANTHERLSPQGRYTADYREACLTTAQHIAMLIRTKPLRQAALAKEERG